MIGETTVHASPAIEDQQPTGSPSGGEQRDKANAPAAPKPVEEARPEEFGGRPGPDPTRYGDWEKNGRCIVF